MDTIIPKPKQTHVTDDTSTMKPADTPPLVISPVRTRSKTRFNIGANAFTPSPVPQTDGPHNYNDSLL